MKLKNHPTESSCTQWTLKLLPNKLHVLLGQCRFLDACKTIRKSSADLRQDRFFALVKDADHAVQGQQWQRLAVSQTVNRTEVFN